MHLQRKALRDVVQVSGPGLHLLDQERDTEGQIGKLGFDVSCDGQIGIVF